MKLLIVTDSGRSEVALEPGQFTLGALDDNAIQINHESISGHHAVIDVSSTGQVLIQSLIPYGMIDSDGDAQEMLTLFPGDYCSMGKVKIARESLVAAPVDSTPPIEHSNAFPETEVGQHEWRDLLTYPFRQDAWVLFLALFILDCGAKLLSLGMGVIASVPSLLLHILFAIILLGTFRDIVQSTLDGEHSLRMTLADSFDFEKSKEMYLSFILVTIVFLGPFQLLRFFEAVPDSVGYILLVLGGMMLPMALLLFIVTDNILAGLHIPAILKAMFRSPLSYAGVLFWIGMVVGLQWGVHILQRYVTSLGFMSLILYFIQSFFEIFFLFILARSLGLYAYRHMRQ